jgi:transcriptional regulator of acetoin/glycerol metabolism
MVGRPDEIAESWRRCAAYGVGPGSPLPAVDLVDRELVDYREAHPLAPALPVVRAMLAQHAVDDGLIVAVGDASGRLLWLEGHSGVLRRAERVHFVAGSRWAERDAGTNAPALALALDRAVRVRGGEHLIEPVRRWSCSAAPVHDPGTGAPLGFVDVTGAAPAASSSLLALVRLTVDAVESSLRRVLAADLTVLGRREGLLGRLRVSRRHAEILLLLEAHPAGLGAEELAVLLDERTLDPVTVRAEMTRLRHAVGVDLVGSRPYRLIRAMRSDVSLIRELLARRLVGEAVRRYPGPVLPRSRAPGIAEIRDNLAAELRAAVLLDADPDTVLAFAETEHGAHDVQVWRAAGRLLPAGSTRLPFVLGRLRALAERDPLAGQATLLQPQRH